MLVSEMIENVRDQLLERNIDPITDRLIVNRLNDAYRFVYNKFAKSNDNMFGENIYLQINVGQSEYELPKGLWNKRIETFEVPNPPTNNGNNPKQVYSFLKIEKTDRRQMAYYDMPAYSTIVPTKWAQFGNKIRVIPPPSMPYLARVFQIPGLVKLGVPQGRIVEISKDTLTLDNGTTEQLEELLVSATPFISISDFQTGVLKAVYPIIGTNNNKIQLGQSTRTEFQGTKITNVKKVTIKSITVPTNKTLISDIGFGHGLKAGDVIQINRTLNTSQDYRVQAGVSSTFERPEIPAPLPSDNLTEFVTLTSTGPTTISWIDQAYVPLYINGFKNGQTPNNAAVVSITAPSVSFGTPYTVLFSSPIAGTNSVAGGLWNVKVFEEIRVSLTGTGSTPSSLNTATYVSAQVTANNQISLRFQPTVVGNSGFSGTINLAPLASNWTGTPELLDSTSSLRFTYGEAFANVPETLARTVVDIELSGQTLNNTDINLDDVVTLGVSTGCSIFGPAFGEFLWQRALLAIRGSLNENDPEINKQIRALENEVTGDTAGRPLGRKIERTFGPGGNYTRQTRG